MEPQDGPSLHDALAADAGGVRPTRVGPTRASRQLELHVLRELAEYQGERRVTGTTLLEATLVARQAHIWTLEDGEHLLLLMQTRRFCYWEASRDSLDELRQRACDWLTEPIGSTV